MIEKREDIMTYDAELEAEIEADIQKWIKLQTWIKFNLEEWKKNIREDRNLMDHRFLDHLESLYDSVAGLEKRTDLFRELLDRNNDINGKCNDLMLFRVKQIEERNDLLLDRIKQLVCDIVVVEANRE